MLPITKKICNFKTGDCFRACVASILELQIEYVPNFMSDGPNCFDQNLREWGDRNGFRAIDIQIEGTNDIKNIDLVLRDCYVIATGESPRNKKYFHSVVWFNGELLHDPHPDRTGISGTPRMFTVLVLKEVRYIKGILENMI